MDGETRDPKTGKYSNGCRYPADPQGRPEEVYNCRCTQIAKLKGFEHDFSDMSWRNDKKLEGMSYDEWKAVHKEKPKSSSPEYKKAIEKLSKESTYIKPKRWDKQSSQSLTSSRIIKMIGQRDDTDGNCTSVALAYIGNKAGYDIKSQISKEVKQESTLLTTTILRALQSLKA